MAGSRDRRDQTSLSDVIGQRQQKSGKHIFCIFILGRLTCGKESGPSLLPLQISPGEASGRKHMSLRMRDEIGDVWFSEPRPGHQLRPAPSRHHGSSIWRQTGPPEGAPSWRYDTMLFYSFLATLKKKKKSIPNPTTTQVASRWGQEYGAEDWLQKQIDKFFEIQ